jgi:hypothetical protein
MCEHVRMLVVRPVLTCHGCDVWQLLRKNVVIAIAVEQWNRGALS